MLREQLLQGLNVLIIEDSGAMAGILASMVQALGCKKYEIASTFTDAQTCLELNRYQLILLDINLDHNHDGVALAKWMRERDWNCSALLIFVTGNTSRTVVDAAKDVSPDGYIAKPLSPARLTAVISRALLRRERAGQPVAVDTEDDFLKGVDEVVVNAQGEVAEPQCASSSLDESAKVADTTSTADTPLSC
ncbi:MAG: response regulator [Marinobacterium sp.]|nr:response regulator [Marinobacterium sp.]